MNNVGIDFSQDRDVVAHECGHAALNALKPSLESLAGLGFHEGYGDLMAILTACDDDALINEALRQTNGDLRRSNIISRLGDRADATLGPVLRHPHTYMRDGSVLVKLSAIKDVPNLLDRESLIDAI